MIGIADTKGPRPDPPPWMDAYAKGALLQMDILTRVSGLGYIFDDFDTVDDWIMVHGQLRVSGGATSDVQGPILGYAAGRHKTQLLTDNCRAKVTIQDGVIGLGESRVVICADERMNAYYGMAIRTGALNDKVSIVRGNSSISVDEYEETTVTVSSGDEFEVWYDRLNSTVRVYQNSAEICAKYFSPTDIPHGPGCRYTGVVMSARRLPDNGPAFDDFTATDAAYPAPEVHDAVDSLTVNPGWVPVLNEAEVHRHFALPLTLGPKKALWTETAVRWLTPMSTDSVRAVITASKIENGTFRLAVRADSDLTNWIGVEFDGFFNQIRVARGTGPTTQFFYGLAHVWKTHHRQWTVTWDEDTGVISLYRASEPSPVISVDMTGEFTGTGRYVGLIWESALASAGVEPSSIDVYPVTADSPLPGS